MIGSESKKGLNKNQVTNMTWFFLFFSLTIIAVQQASAQIYKWVDENGQIHYGDNKPNSDSTNNLAQPKIEEVELKVYVPKPDPEVVLKDVEANAAKDTTVFKWSPKGKDKDKISKQKRRGDLVMYSTKVCGYCKKARAYFKKKRIRYREIDINATANNRNEFEKQGGKGVPYFVMNKRKKSGFSEASFDQFYFKKH